MRFDLRDFRGLKSTDVVGLLGGRKRLVSTGISAADRPALLRAFARYGLVFATTGPAADFKRRHVTYLVARERGALEAALAAYRDRRFGLVGELLGYPACCVRRYSRKASRLGEMDDFVRGCCRASRSFRWEINNLLDFDGRLGGAKAAGLDRRGERELSLISHNPCSYDCAPSVELARLNYRDLAAAGADTAPYAALRLPVLYLDDFNFALLEGRSRKGSAAYARPWRVLGMERLSGALGEGDRVEVSGRLLRVLRGRAALLEEVLPEPPLLLPFDRGGPGPGC